MLFQKDAFGYPLLFKRILIFAIGVITYPMFHWFNRTKISGMEHLIGLPKKGVLFVSNHQSYFMDVISMYYVFGSLKWGFMNTIKNPLFLINPRLRLYYIAAEETMKAGFMPKMLAYAGSVSIKRTWREAGQDVNKQVDLKDISKIGTALDDGWVITFPQGTTTPFIKGRRGTSHIIKKYQPIVVPVVIDGFRRAFAKKKLGMKKSGGTISIRFKKPLDINYEDSSDAILAQIMDAIEQSEKYKDGERDKQGNI